MIPKLYSDLLQSVNGVNGSQSRLRQLSMDLQTPELKDGLLKSRGRCAAKFEGLWYRLVVLNLQFVVIGLSVFFIPQQVKFERGMEESPYI